MSYHSTARQPKQSTGKQSPLRFAGVLLSLLALLLSAIAVFLHANTASLIIALIICLFSLRLFLLWMGSNKTENAAQSPATSRAFHEAHASSNGSYEYNGWQQDTYQQGHVEAQQPVPASSYAQAAQYVPQPAFTPAMAYAQGGDAAQISGYAQPARPAKPYVPIAEDEMFALDAPGNDECCYLLPKEGEPLVECQDRYALNSLSRCYAVADGVAGSFVPGPWARTVAKGFVERNGEFAGREDFQRWLAERGERWQAWMEETWVPTMNALRQRNGDGPGDWSNDIRTGAQTTLVGCSLQRNPDFHDVSTLVRVFAIGDSEFFRFSPGADGNWSLAEAFPFTNPAEFNARPDTLVSLPRADLLEMAWQRRKTMVCNAYPGDRLVLASDTLAKWLLGQVQQGDAARWMPLITCNNAAEFEQRIRQAFYADHVEDDDITMLVIPIS